MKVALADGASGPVSWNRPYAGTAVLALLSDPDSGKGASCALTREPQNDRMMSTAAVQGVRSLIIVCVDDARPSRCDLTGCRVLKVKQGKTGQAR